MKNKTAAIFLIFFAIVAFLPLIQQRFHIIKLAGLQGAFDGGEQPVFMLSSWFDGSFQSGTDRYLKYNTAFNGELVRLRNQLEYTFFGNINTILTLGKDNYIFDPNYILSREGKNYINEQNRVLKEEAIKNSATVLDSLKIPVLILFAPNKANYYVEYLPVATLCSKETNKHFYQKLIEENKFSNIDFDSLFLLKKQSSQFVLIPKYGAHWSTYGAALAADTLLKKVGNLVDKKISKFEISAIELSDTPQFTDDDYLASLNLMQKFKSPKMAYPQLQFDVGYKINALIVSDSFIWNLYDLGVIQNCFDNKTELRYYNKTLYDFGKNNKGPLLNKIQIEDLRGRDIIILLTSDPGLTDFGYGIFEEIQNLPNE